MRELDVDLNGRNILAAAFRHGIREVAAEHSTEHPATVDGCEGCKYVGYAASITVTPEQDAADFPVKAGDA